MSASKNLTFTIDGVRFKMIHVKGGAFIKNGELSKLPDYYIGETPVTQALWMAVCGSNPSLNPGEQNPVENISWHDINEFIKQLNERTGEQFSLPTEDYWEFAAVGGIKSRGFKYPGGNNLDDVAWYYGGPSSLTHPVAQKVPNEIGLYDMLGNVGELCSDPSPIKVIKGSSTSSSIFNSEGALDDDKDGEVGFRLFMAEASNRAFNTTSKNEAIDFIHAAFESINLEIEEMEVNESYICTQYVIKSFKPLPSFRGRAIYKIENTLPEYLYPHQYRFSITEESIYIELKTEHPLPPPSLLPQLESEEFISSPAKIPIPIGETMDGRLRIMDLAEAPHFLIAGATMQGKTQFLHSTIASLLHPRNQPCELVLIDPKGYEFKKRYSSVVKDIYETADEVLTKLNSMLDNLRNRYIVKTALTGELTPTVVIIDEYADLIMTAGCSPAERKMAKDIESSIIQLAQKGKAVGIHIILATQRPSNNVITGLIKANFPTRIAFRVVSKADSMTIIDTDGAEKLYGKGDMLFAEGVEIERLQGYHITEEEFKNFSLKL